MDIKILKYFLAVAREGTITRAAEKLSIAQPPLSRHMQLLEEELGVTLFVRGKRRIRLTEEGIFLKQQAEEIITLMEKTENQLSKIKTNTHGTIALGVTETSGASILSSLIGAFHRQYPYIRYNIVGGSVDEVKEKLEKGLVDMGLVRDPFDTETYESIFWKTESWIALLSRDHPLARAASGTVELRQLAGESLIIPARPQLQNEIHNWFNLLSEERNIFCLYNTLSCVVPMVEDNIGIAICPESAQYTTNPQKLAYLKIIRPEHSSNLMLVRRRHQLLPTATECFWDFTRNYLKTAAETPPVPKKPQPRP